MYTCKNCIWHPTCVRTNRVAPLSDNFVYECDDIETKCEAFAKPVACYDGNIKSLCGGGYRNVASGANYTCLIWCLPLTSENTHEWWELIKEAVNSVPEAWRNHYRVFVKGKYTIALRNTYGDDIEDDECYKHMSPSRPYCVHNVGENAYVIMKLPDEVTQPQGEMP